MPESIKTNCLNLTILFGSHKMASYIRIVQTLTISRYPLTHTTRVPYSRFQALDVLSCVHLYDHFKIPQQICCQSQSSFGCIKCKLPKLTSGPPSSSDPISSRKKQLILRPEAGGARTSFRLVTSLLTLTKI